MPSIVYRIVCSDPSGRPTSLIQFTAALAFLGIYLYAWSAGAGDTSSWLLVMTVGAALSGVAESLPNDRSIAAGTLRSVAVAILVSLLVAMVVAPNSNVV
jgi:hypothetical protein